MSRTYAVYILANRTRNLYTGMTNNLERRIIEHRQQLIPGFTSRYAIFRLVHFEFFNDVRSAIAREKEIKGWRREKKIRLIESDNPTWLDLADHFPAIHKKPDPSHRSPKPGDRVRDDNQPAKHSLGAPAATSVIPNRATTRSPQTRQSPPASNHSNTREGSAFSSPSAPGAKPVIPNECEGSAFSFLHQKPAPKP